MNLPACHLSNGFSSIIGLHIFPCCLILSETLSRVWGERRLCGAAGRNWIGPFQDDAFSWSLLSLSWPWWDVSLIIIYVPIKIISLSKTSYFFCTWESNFHTHTHTKPSILHIEPVWGSYIWAYVQYLKCITDFGRETCEVTRIHV